MCPMNLPVALADAIFNALTQPDQEDWKEFYECPDSFGSLRQRLKHEIAKRSRDELVDWLEEFGRPTLKRAIEAAGGAGFTIPRSLREMASALLVLLGARRPIVRACPLGLYRDANEKLEQVFIATPDDGAAYELAKSQAPELERLFRLLVYFYLEACEDPCGMGEAISGALADYPFDSEYKAVDSPLKDPIKTLSKLSLSELSWILGKMDRVPSQATALDYWEGPWLVEGKERAFLVDIARLRNRIAHGKADRSDGKELCERIRALFDSWRARLDQEVGRMVPRGVVVEESRDLGHAAELRCLDRSSRRELLRCSEPRKTGDCLLVPDMIPEWNDRVVVVPDGAEWETPSLGA